MTNFINKYIYDDPEICKTTGRPKKEERLNSCRRKDNEKIKPKENVIQNVKRKGLKKEELIPKYRKI